jgi:hypothetical protein
MFEFDTIIAQFGIFNNFFIPCIFCECAQFELEVHEISLKLVQK